MPLISLLPELSKKCPRCAFDIVQLSTVVRQFRTILMFQNKIRELEQRVREERLHRRQMQEKAAEVLKLVPIKYGLESRKW